MNILRKVKIVSKRLRRCGKRLETLQVENKMHDGNEDKLDNAIGELQNNIAEMSNPI